MIKSRAGSTCPFSRKDNNKSRGAAFSSGGGHDKATYPDASKPGPYGGSKVFTYLSFLIPERRNTFRQYLYALALTAIALLARLAIAPLEGGIQYVTFFPAVALSAVIGGIWPGLFCALISVSLATWFFWPPFGAFTFDLQHETVLSNAVFLLDAILVCTFIEAMHRFYRKFVDTTKELSLSASVFHNSAEGVLITDANSTILSVNPAFTEITGYSAAEAIGRKPSLLHSDRNEPAFYQAMWRALNGEGCWKGEIWNRRKDGEAFLEWLTINRIDDSNGVPVRYVSVFHDITELRRRDEQIRHLAFHDALTGLPNRALFEDRLRHAIARLQREGGHLSVAFVDFDQFKIVNDSHGHDIGDLLLQEAATRIKSCLRVADTVARMGGDEFVILMEDMRPDKSCADLAEAIIAEISRPMEIRGHTVQIGASIGISFFPQDGTHPVELMKRADLAMYAAKSAGRNTFRFFQPEMLDKSEPSGTDA